MSKLEENQLVKPAPGYYLVEPIDDQIVGDFVIAQKYAYEEQLSRVLDVGESVPFESDPQVIRTPHAKVGDVIFHKTWNAEPTKYKGKTFRLIPFSDLKGWAN